MPAASGIRGAARDDTGFVPGLSSEEAARRLAADGPNALPDAARHGWPAILADAAREPMFLLLLGAAGLYLLLGEPRESVSLLVMVVLMVGLTLYQEGRAERALQALRDLGAPTATVLRDGTLRRISATDLVRGDVVALAEGDRVPADALLVEAGGMLVDESLLTGESVPVYKRAGDLAGDRTSAPPPPGGDGLAWVFAGTLVVQGHGLAELRAIGAHSELGRIGAALGGITPPASRLQRETRTLARRMAVLGVAASLLLVLLIGLRGAGWLQALLAGVALSMSLLPEEFPVILTVFPALGAWRLARLKVLTRRLAAIEILGSTSVLCVDKTGTLTENRMALRRLWRDGTAYDLAHTHTLPAPLAGLLATAIHASRPDSPDPIEQALHQAAGRVEAGVGSSEPASLEREYGLSAQQPFVARIWRPEDREPDAQAAVKGAPEAVLALCRGSMHENDHESALAAAAELARAGMRVLAVAEARGVVPPWPDDPARLPWQLVGLAAFADPLRADIPDAVAQCRQAGVRVVMITGDHPETARAIARQAGLADGETLTGSAIAAMEQAELPARLGGVSVCARIVPSQKLAIVRALQADGAVVAMTGDGVNDAPALRAADVGVAMGLRGTDVAREAAELTLLDDRFASLVHALRMGRRIFSNMRKSMRYVAAIHVPITVLALLPPLVGWPILLYPMHIVFLELVIDPACSLAFENEPEEPDLMQRPPRARDEPLLGRRVLAMALLSGLWAAALLVACYGIALARLPEPEARATVFTALILCNLGLLLAYRRRRGAGAGMLSGNPLILAVCAVALGMLAVALFLPTPAEMFRFSLPSPAWLGFGLLAPLLLWPVFRFLRAD